MNETEKRVEELLEDYPALEDEPELLEALALGEVEVTQHHEETGHRRVRVGIVKESGLASGLVHDSVFRSVVPSEYGVEAEGFVVDVDLDALVENELADGWTWTAVEEVEKA